jgi:hypothetical protein
MKAIFKWRPEYPWYIIMAITFLLYQNVQDWWRPAYKGDSELWRYLLGIAPNFLPGIGLTAFIYAALPDLTPAQKYTKWYVEQRHRTALFICMTGLIAWEVCQLTGGLYFDWNDILWTLIGGGCFYALWRLGPAAWRQHSVLLEAEVLQEKNV